MEAELTALATSGATTLVGLMASDAWTQVRTRLARFFARGGDVETADEQLELSRQELVAARAAADDLAAGDVEAEWRTRLRRALQADPATAAELRLLLAELAPEADRAPTVSVHNTISGAVANSSVVQAHDITASGGLVLGAVHPDTRPGPPTQ